MDPNNFPKPPPDRRKLTQPSIKENEPHPNPKQPSSKPKDQILKETNNTDDQERREIESKIFQVLKKNINDLRSNLSEFKIMKKDIITNPSLAKSIPESLNIILFGPSGSGKSSLIKTFYQAYNNLPRLTSELQSKLIIQGLDQNEGTKKFTKVVIKPGKKSLIDAGSRKLVIENSEIAVFDTRGQILMDEKEINQLNLLIHGRVKDFSLVEQRNFRYAYLLWEFWKKDTELFPSEILVKEDFTTQPHALIFVFDGSLDEVPNGAEETMFYKEIIEKARKKKYFYPQIVLTRVDKVEEKLNKAYYKKKSTDDENFDKEAKLRELIDKKIESVVSKLAIPRSSVHFIENYHEKHEKSDVSIDYYALKLLEETCKQGEKYVEVKLAEKKDEKCRIF